MTLEGAGRFETGRGDALAPARTRLIDAEGGNAGVLTLSAIGAKAYAELVERVTGADVVISSNNDLVVSTLPDAGAERLPESGEVEDRRPRAAHHRLRRPELRRRPRQRAHARRA